VAAGLLAVACDLPRQNACKRLCPVQTREAELARKGQQSGKAPFNSAALITTESGCYY
jgi:hypothetical protein